jgi:hypothetical protein
VVSSVALSSGVTVCVAVLGEGRVVAAVLPDGDVLGDAVLAADDELALAEVLGVCTDGAPHAANITTANKATTTRCVDRIIHPPNSTQHVLRNMLRTEHTHGVKYCQGMNETFVAF